MSQTETGKTQVSRRTLAKGAAWSVPVIATAAAAPAASASTACEVTYQTVTKTFTFNDVISQPATVAVTATNVPLVVPNGSSVAAIAISATTTLGATSSSVLPTLLGNATQIAGTVVSASELSGVATETVTANLTIPMTKLANPAVIPADGASPAMTLTATGNGSVVITMGAPIPTLTGYDDTGATTSDPQALPLTKIDGNDYTLATFTVVDAC